jgi:Nucleotidyltransferase domain
METPTTPKRMMEPTLIADELKELARMLADWAAPSASTIYLYGSRVRGDHGPNSDVDIWPDWAGSKEEVVWWTENNKNDFADINSKLPGKLHVLPPNDPVKDKVRFGPVVYRDRNISCVLLPRIKPLGS